MTQVDMTLQERHFVALRTALARNNGHEAAAYVFFGVSRIDLDPWDRRARLRLTSYRVEPVPERDLISASRKHITWSTRSFVDACRRAKEEGLVVGIAHSHPSGYPTFSEQDDQNELELVRLARNRNGQAEMLPSVLLIGESTFAGRVWLDETSPVGVASMQTVGSNFRYLDTMGGFQDDAFARQALAFGPAVNVILRRLKIGVVGCGGTGSAVAMLLGRLGVGQIALFDDDIVEVTNLNRLHGATRADADAMRPKVEVVARELARSGLGVRAIPIAHLADSREARDTLLSCDIVFGCTDDHAGRMFLNRLAYFYLRPVIDLGLAISPRSPEGDVASMIGRVTVLRPGTACLLCRKVADPQTAAAEELRRAAPAEYERQKREAYVRGAENPAPAVVTFTTETATMAINEMMQGLTGFRGDSGWAAQRTRRFDIGVERLQGAKQDPNCILCVDEAYWGRGDIIPFMDRVGKV
tara:strand:+ start:21622 stop:23034 length:1413 start_codon:yes stop_codon:yes gene_type:complete